MTRSVMLTAFLVSTAPAVASAQSSVLIETSKPVTVHGTVESVSKSGIVMKLDGKLQPVPMSPKTKFLVDAIGDAGFVRVGSILSVTGTVLPNGGLANASIVVHANPALTAPQKIVSLDSDAKTRELNGVVTNLNPLTLDLTDLFIPTIKSGSIRARAGIPPVPGGTIVVQPSEKAKQTVTVRLGPAMNKVSPGDSIYVTYSKKYLPFAATVVVTTKEQLSSASVADGGKDEKKN